MGKEVVIGFVIYNWGEFERVWRFAVVRLRDRNAVLLEILEHAPLPVNLEAGVQLERGRA